MEIALRLKFTQHPALKALLLGTGEADLIEVRGALSLHPALGFNRFQDSPRDYFWGIGADYSGRNELGKALVRLRKELRQEQDDPTHIPTARRDATRLSIQDLTSLVPAQPITNVSVHHSSISSTLVSGSGPVNPEITITSPQGNGVCEVRSITCPKMTTRHLIDGNYSSAK